jgi:hypothetical protein
MLDLSEGENSGIAGGEEDAGLGQVVMQLVESGTHHVGVIFDMGDHSIAGTVLGGEGQFLGITGYTVDIDPATPEVPRDPEPVRAAAPYYQGG